MTVIEKINANKADGAIKMGLSVFTSGMKPVFDGGCTFANVYQKTEYEIYSNREKPKTRQEVHHDRNK